MNELQRQAYMDAMGVDCYMPRLQLPGALPSQLCELPSLDVIAELVEQTDATSTAHNSIAHNKTNQSPATAQSAVGSGRAAAMQALFDEKPKSVDHNVVKTAESPSSPKAAKQQVPHFSLSITRGQGVLLVDGGLPGDINPAEYLQLLQNILFAIGVGNQPLSIDTFAWPMVRNSQVDQSETAARQTLEAFIAKQIEQLNARYILVLGQTAAQYLSQQTLPVGQFVRHSALDAQLLHTQSAYPLLSDASLKREVWRDLQPLYRVLKKS